MVSGLVYSTHAPTASDTPSSSDPLNDGERSDLSPPPSTLGATPTSAAGGPLTTQGSDSYVGPTHWASILESIHDIRGLIDTEVEDHPTPEPPSHMHTSNNDITFGPCAPVTMEQAVARLPPKNWTDRLVFLYFGSRFTAAPYIHTSKFQREYDGFWRDPSSVSLLWVSILASILFVASSISIVKGEDITKETDAAHPDRLADLAKDCLVAGDYLSAKPYSIEALLLQGYTELQRRRECDSSLWAKFGLLVRLAQRMGYHRDPKYLPKVTPFEGELRRRAWFFIEVFDCLFSFQLGMPPIVRDDECDTESPGNLIDLDFDENAMALPPPRPLTETTSTLYLSYKSKLCRKLRRAIRYALLIQPPPYEEILKLNNEIHQYHDQIPSNLRIRPVRSYSFTDQSFDILHRLMLELMYLKSLCVLHRKYLNSENDNPRYNLSRSTCVDAALRILDLHAEYEEESRPGGRLYDDKHMLSSLSLHDFLLASMILCLDLTETVAPSHADRSRKLKALGTSYKIWSEKKHISHDAAHATRVMGAILRRVSMQEAKTPAAPPRPPQPEVRDGSLASLLNNDTQPPPMMSTPIVDQSQLISAMDFSLDGLDSIPLDSVMSDPSQYDWNVIDQYLLSGPGVP
ncbi:fungal-specific transcription factor domain-containing protein [Pseudomassariella vexata]|uniref:Fungal-specific transcription factor domain-domain-containing protein n=1 Tax=Pseudomassariella vexata TaxID=1141098 RepID=A0A1Y2DJY2_9PEZI|nr:fungal-specific transcription factor domain-containing protein [Pseudomassariella vexata]ORY59562.1 fungal-specific transcription factor domain-domain-containing protein [Pseudomassariella vexata]